MPGVTEEVLRECVLLDMSTAMPRTPVSQAHGSGRAFPNPLVDIDRSYRKCPLKLCPCSRVYGPKPAPPHRLRLQRLAKHAYLFS